MPRNAVIQIRVSAEEKANYGAAAKLATLSVAEWLRGLAETGVNASTPLGDPPWPTGEKRYAHQRLSFG